MNPQVFIIDDDAAMRRYLARLLERNTYLTREFVSAEDFLEYWHFDATGCIITDLQLPGIDGLTLQAELKSRGCQMPLIMITGHGDIPTARRAFLSQAIDFIEKPLDTDALIQSVWRAMQLERTRAKSTRLRKRHEETLAKLTRRERQIFDLVGQGFLPGEIGERLKISPRTVETHKFHIMTKLEARNAVELVRIATRFPDKNQSA